MAGLVFGCCSDEMHMEEQMLKDERIKLSAGNSLMITKSGLEYENFEEGTKYLLYGVEIGKDWTAENTIMNRTAAEETSKHLIRYGETAIRCNSSMIVRMYCTRSLTSMPMAFSIHIQSA